MYVGLTLSLTAHVVLLGWALISFQATPPLKIPDPEPVEVALISADELVRLTKGDRSSKNLKTQTSKQTEKAPVKKEAKKAVIKTVQPPAASEPPPTPKADDIAKKLASLEPPKPAGPTLEELAAKEAAAEKLKAAEKAAAELALQKAAEEAKKKAEAEKKQAEAEKKRKAAEAKRKKAEAEKKRKKKLAEKRAKARKRKLAEKRRRERERKAKAFDSGKISALLNKIPDAKAPKSGSPDPNNDRKLPKGAQAGATEGRDTRLTASQRSLLAGIIDRTFQPRWRINCGVAGIENIVVKVEVHFRRDGYLAKEPRVVNSISSPLFRPAADLALAAIKSAEPVQWPQEFYERGWKGATVRFPARQACGL